MVKVKNKVLIALSVLLCAVLLSGVFVFAKPQTESGIEVKAESTTLTDEQITQRRANPGLYETNSMNFVKNSNGQDYTWQQMIDDGIVTITDGHLLVDGSNGVLSGDLVVGSVDGLTSLGMSFKYLNIETLDLYNLDTTEVTDMHMIAFNCYTIKHLYWNKETFKTRNVTNMSNMFSGLFNMEDDLDVSHFDTSNVTTMNGMFNVGSSSIIFGEKFVTSQVTDMSNMFSGCTNLTGLVFPSTFDTSKVTKMSYMFKNCSSLKNMDISSFDLNLVVVLDSMFSGCTSLQSVNLPEFNYAGTRKSVSVFSMFEGCTSLKNAKLIYTADNSIDLYSMFIDCTNLREVDLSEANLSSISDCEDMFSGCNNLTKIILPTNIDSTASIVLPTITDVVVTNADHYGYVGDNGEVVSITTDGATTITSEMEGKTIELYDSENNSLVAIAPTEPATGVNASVIAIVCSIVAVLMIVIAYGVISNKKNSKRKINAINIDNNKIK